MFKKLLGIFIKKTPHPLTTPAVFRSGRVEQSAPIKNNTQQDRDHTRWLLVEFGTSPDAKKFKKIVQGALTATSEGCAAMTHARQKTNGRAVIVNFSADWKYAKYADSAYDFFNAMLEVFAMNAGGLKLLTPDAANSSRVWQDCQWREIVTPQHADGSVVGYVLAAEVGSRIV